MSSLDLLALPTRAGRDKNLSALVPLATKELSRPARGVCWVCWVGWIETGGGTEGSVVIKSVAER